MKLPEPRRGSPPAGQSSRRLHAAIIPSLNFVSLVCVCVLGGLTLVPTLAAARRSTPPAPTTSSSPPPAAADAADGKSPQEAPPILLAEIQARAERVIRARRALVEGRFADVESIAAEPGASPAVQIIRARADIERGRYDEAQQQLRTLSASSAKGIGKGGDATLELGLLQWRRGQRVDATESLRQVLIAFQEQTNEPTAETFVRAGRAARALGQHRMANSMLQRASLMDPRTPDAQTAWGELFFEKYNVPEAVEAFQAALKIDPKWVPALVGLARAQADNNSELASRAASEALAINPQSVDARLLLADLALDGRVLKDAKTHIAEALKVNPSSLDAIALDAAVAQIEGRPEDVDRLAKQALAINPLFGDIYRVPGRHVAGHYRFDEAAALTERALQVDPDSTRARADLGMHLLRTGDEPGARKALEKAFSQDSYDFVTYNLLQMLDSLDKFETIQDGDLVIRMHPEDAKVMREAVRSLSRDAMAALRERYGFTPKGPILIELFPRHDDFAVRTLGLPGMVGALGACFGRVVTLDSPRARPPGSFNWAATLWHELAHVYTLQLSEQRVPRWLTEGISVFEERRARPAWGREGEFDFIRTMARDELIPVRELNAAFTSGRTINLAYHESSLLVEHIHERFGDEGLRTLVAAYRDGTTNEDALRKSLNLDIDALQTSFTQFLDKRFGAAKAALADATGKDTGEEGQEDADASGRPEADPSPNPETPRPETPNPETPKPGTPGPGTTPTVTVQGATAGQAAEAAAARAYADAHPDSYVAQVQAGRRLLDIGDLAAARKALERAVLLVPQTMGDVSARAMLATVLEKQSNPADAMKEMATLVLESHTALRTARRLAVLAREADDTAREQLAIDRIVQLDPFDAAGHVALGRLALARQDVTAARAAFELALTLNPPDPAGVHTDLAETYLLSGQMAEVKRHAIAALEISPRFERAQDLLLRVVDKRGQDERR